MKKSSEKIAKLCVQLKTRFLNFQTLKPYISEVLWAEKLNEVLLEKELTTLHSNGQSALFSPAHTHIKLLMFKLVIYS